MSEFITMGILIALSFLSVGIASILYNTILINLPQPLRTLLFIAWLIFAYTIIYIIMVNNIEF